jgi:hypothetical protein
MQRLSLTLLAIALLALALVDARTVKRDDPASKAASDNSSKNRALSIVSQTATQVEFKSETNDNSFDFKADLSSNAPRMVVDWENGENIDYKVEVQLFELLEFVDAGNDGYSAGDNVVKTTDYTQSGSWGPYTTPSKDANGVWSFSITHTSSNTQVTFKFAENDFNNATLAVPSTGVKFDFAINGYTYAQAGTDLALHARVLFSNDCDLKEFQGSGSGSNNDDALVFTSASTAEVFFQWATVLDSPAGAAVNASKPSGISGSSNDIYFTFDVKNSHATTNILWDPVYGVSGAGSLAASILAVLLAVALLF